MIELKRANNKFVHDRSCQFRQPAKNRLVEMMNCKIMFQDPMLLTNAPSWKVRSKSTIQQRQYIAYESMEGHVIQTGCVSTREVALY